MFKLEATGCERSDCTIPYQVIFDKEYTVEEFINIVLSERPREWGSVGINDGSSVLGNPRFHYKYGKLLTALTADVVDKKIVSARAVGGWGNMDYILTLEGDPNG